MMSGSLISLPPYFAEVPMKSSIALGSSFAVALFPIVAAMSAARINANSASQEMNVVAHSAPLVQEQIDLIGKLLY